MLRVHRALSERSAGASFLWVQLTGSGLHGIARKLLENGVKLVTEDVENATRPLGHMATISAARPFGRHRRHSWWPSCLRKRVALKMA